MLRNLMMLALACMAALFASCSSGSVRHEISKQAEDFCRVVSDVDTVGCPAIVRCRAEVDPGHIDIESWSWGVSNGKIVEQNANGSEVWVRMDNPGACQLSARGVDKNGNDCTTPKHKLMSNKKTNAAPIVIDFGGPRGPIPGEEPGDDGSVLRYHEWRWQNARGYDPEDRARGIEIQSWSWGIYDGPDDDGDGLDDKLICGEAPNGTVHNPYPGSMRALVTGGQHTFAVRAYYDSFDPPAPIRFPRCEVTVQDSSGQRRKWGDGHVTLMKAYDDGNE